MKVANGHLYCLTPVIKWDLSKLQSTNKQQHIGWTLDSSQRSPFISFFHQGRKQNEASSALLHIQVF